MTQVLVLVAILIGIGAGVLFSVLITQMLLG
jgi:hypothetical protein